MSYTMISSDDPSKDGAKIYRKKIVDGDKLGEIAKQYGQDLNALAALNNIENPNKIHSGDDISIPLNKNITQGVEDEYIKLSKEDTNGDGCVERYENSQRYIANAENNTEGPKLEQESAGIFGVLGKTENATFTSDGSLTYQELADNLGVPLEKLLPSSSVGAGTVIPKGAKIALEDKDLPEVPVFNGITQSTFGTRLYIDIDDSIIKDTSNMSNKDKREYQKQLSGIVASYGDITKDYDVDDLQIKDGRIMLFKNTSLLGYY